MESFVLLPQKKPEKNRFFFKNALNFSLLVLFLLPANNEKGHWGFWAHKRITRLAIYRLPVEMKVFYKKYMDYLSENAVNPDKRRYAVVGEAERHFIDLDVYGDSALAVLPKNWQAAVQKIGEDSLRKHGIVPWHVQAAASQLIAAFKDKNISRILRVSADIGHYIADAHVPLHTTRNYNGQLTGQEGIHGFWESRLPELFAEGYDMWLGPVIYRKDIAHDIWKAVADSHAAMDSVLLFEKQLTEGFRADKKYGFELRNNVLTRMHSREFSEKYHRMLAGQVERRMRASVQMVGDIWYTCWIDAGQPDLGVLANTGRGQPEQNPEAAEQQNWLQRLLDVRPEPEN